MNSPIITLLLISAPLAEPNSLTVKGEPLLEVIESRLASVDEIVRRKEDRSARPTDKWFRYRFYSRSLADSVQPAFPAGLPGTIPLLEHADPRVRCSLSGLVGLGGLLTPGGAARLRRSALPRAVMSVPLRA